MPRATPLASTVGIGSGPLAVPERLDDLPVPNAHEVHAPVVLGASDPPADDGAITVDVDVLDRELDCGVGGQPLPAGEAFVVARPSVAVGRWAGALHHAVVGDEVDELLGCPFEEGGVVLVDDSGGVGHGRIVRRGGLRSNSLEGMASMYGVGEDQPVMSRFPSELRRWRTAR